MSISLNAASAIAGRSQFIVLRQQWRYGNCAFVTETLQGIRLPSGVARAAQKSFRWRNRPLSFAISCCKRQRGNGFRQKTFGEVNHKRGLAVLAMGQA